MILSIVLSGNGGQKHHTPGIAAICPWLEEKGKKERGELGQSGAFLKSALSKCRYLKRVLKAGCMGHRE